MHIEGQFKTIRELRLDTEHRLSRCFFGETEENLNKLKQFVDNRLEYAFMLGQFDELLKNYNK